MKHLLPLVAAPLVMFSAGCAQDFSSDDADVGVAGAAIIGGEPSAPGTYGATGALLARYQGQLHPFCTGTLIARDVVLTAAHCMVPQPGIVGLPAFTLEDDARSVAPGEAVQGIASIVHPDFDIARLENGYLQDSFDVAILTLAKPILGAPVAVLPDPAEVTSLRAGMDVGIVGYGQTYAESQDVGVKFDATTKLVQLGDSELQVAGPGDPQDCHGDSGGPALANLGNGPRLIGIVSRGMTGGETSCDQGGIDTRVDAFLDWIGSKVDVP